MTDLTPIFQALIASSLIAAAAGLLGSFVLLRRLALMGDALSHIALPGIALGILFHFNLFLGSLVFLITGVFGIWLIEHKTKLSVDTLTGIFFTMALALGALLTPEEELLEALFGDITRINSFDFWLASIFSLIILFALFALSKKLTLTMISPDLALSAGIKVHFLELAFLLIFGFIVAMGIKFTGALLMGSLVIIPAATARNLSRSMKMFQLLSIIIGVAGAFFGIAAFYFYQLPVGPIFVLFATALFFLSIFLRKNRWAIPCG